MKAKVLKGSIVAYTIFVLSAALVLFVLSDQSENFADTEHEVETTIKKDTLPSGEREQTIAYGETVSIQQAFGLTNEQMADLEITTEPMNTKKVGTFQIIVQFKKQDQTSTGTLHLTIKDTQKPTITVENSTIYKETAFDPLAGVKAQDNEEGNLSHKIKTSGTVDTSQEGVYKLTYTVSDTSHNETTKVREVTVVSAPTTESTAVIADPIEEPATSSEMGQTAQEVTTPSSQPTVPAAQQANTLCINGQTIAYQNGGQVNGQAVIDSDTSGAVSTWGGVAVQSGNDGANTHFIGHNPGAFSVLLRTSLGQLVVVTDSNGTATTYTINQIVHLDDYGIEVGTGVDYWDKAIGTGGGERITLQTCLSDTENLMVFATK